MKEKDLVERLCKYARFEEKHNRHFQGKAVYCSEKEGDALCICTKVVCLMAPMPPQYSYVLQDMLECEYRFGDDED